MNITPGSPARGKTSRWMVGWIVMVGLMVIGFGADLILRRVPARPEAAIQTAQNFVDYLRAHELERAYQLTTQQSDVGRSLGEFQGVIRQQWPTATPVSVRFLTVRPLQSYSNRLRRWAHGQEIDPKELWLEFSVDGMPFQVRERRVDGGGWHVDFFQSHAG